MSDDYYGVTSFVPRDWAARNAAAFGATMLPHRVPPKFKTPDAEPPAVHEHKPEPLGPDECLKITICNFEALGDDEWDGE